MIKTINYINPLFQSYQIAFSIYFPVLERVRRIELPTSAWKAGVLPLNYTRMAAPTGFEPAISCVTGRHVDPYTTEPCIKKVTLWTCVQLRGQDLNLWPPGYEPGELPTAPPRDNDKETLQWPEAI